MHYDTDRYSLIQVAKGEQPADVFLKSGRVVNVFSGEILECNVAIYGDRVAYTGSNTHVIGDRTKVIDCTGKFIAPGYIETHAHPWVLYNPVSLTEKVLPLGTTTIVQDNLFFYLFMGAAGFGRMIQDLEKLPGLHRWLVRVVSQGIYDGERAWFNPRDVQSLLSCDEVLGTAEVTRWPLLYAGDPFVIDTIEHAKRLGKLSDGHTSGCSYERLNAIVAAGISACHEAISAEEVIHRLRLGMWTTLRNSSLRPDFPEIVKAITERGVSTHRMLMTTDGPNPRFIHDYGFMDGLLRQAVELGVPPVTALQMATIHAATYLRLDDHIGSVAPGRRADINILPDLVSFRPETVISAGTVVAEKGRLVVEMPTMAWSDYVVQAMFMIEKSVLSNASLYLYTATQDGLQKTPVIDYVSAVISRRLDIDLPDTDGVVDITHDDSLCYAALVDRHGKWISHAIMRNFAHRLEGFASTYNTTTHLLVIGRNPTSMARAATRVYELGGGIVIVDGDDIKLEIPLPLAGMMTPDARFDTALLYYDELDCAMRERGYPYHDILYTLLFMTCDCLPGLRLLPGGIFDVKSGNTIRPCQSLTATTLSTFV